MTSQSGGKADYKTFEPEPDSKPGTARSLSETAKIFVVGLSICVFTALVAAICVTSLALRPVGQPETCLTETCSKTSMDLLRNMDMEADPCQDFERFTCGKLVDRMAIPNYTSSVTRFTMLSEKVHRFVKKLMKEERSDRDPKMVRFSKDFYAACLNRDESPAAIYKHFLDNIVNNEFGGWPVVVGGKFDARKFDLWQVSGFLAGKYDAHPLFSTWVSHDEQNRSRRAIHLGQSSEMFELSSMLGSAGTKEDRTRVLAGYVEEVVKVLARQGGYKIEEAEVKSSVAEMLELAKRLANATVGKDKQRDVSVMFNKMTVRELGSKFPTIDFSKHFSSFFNGSVTLSDDEVVIVGQPRYWQSLEQSLKKADLKTVSNMIFMMVADKWAGQSTEELADAKFKWKSTVTGAKERLSRSDSCERLVEKDDTGFGMAVGAAYVKEVAFDGKAKEEVKRMLNDVVEAFKSLISDSRWMQDEDKKAAVTKADAMVRKVAYPDWIFNNSAVEAFYDGVTAPKLHDHLGNVISMTSWSIRKQIKMFQKPSARGEWTESPLRANAWYSIPDNVLTLPAAILQNPFYTLGRPSALNYGGIGSIMAHEVTHGFDDLGQLFDAQGNLGMRWHNQTQDKFNEAVKCFIDWYSGLNVTGTDQHLNGALIQGETIADSGGLHESFLAYQHHLKARGAKELVLPGLENLTKEQLFFVGWAQLWCRKTTKEAELHQILTERHPPGSFRISGPLSNFEEFAKAFKCAAGTPYNRKNKCLLW